MWVIKSNCNTATLQRFWHSRRATRRFSHSERPFLG